MKNFFETPELFAAKAELDLAFYMLQEMVEKHSKRSPIEMMVDVAAGAEQDRLLDVARLMHIMIRNKKILEMDASNTEAALGKILQVYPQFRDRLEE